RVVSPQLYSLSLHDALPICPRGDLSAAIAGILRLVARCGHLIGRYGARYRSAASTTFVSSIALVIGPTPPGIGARTRAMLLTNRSEEHTSELQSREKLVCRL